MDQHDGATLACNLGVQIHPGNLLLALTRGAGPSGLSPGRV
jgi:hypothetical protein